MRELTVADRICEIGAPQRTPAPDTLPRMYSEDYRTLAFLDKAGLAPSGLIARAVMPGKSDRSVEYKLEKLHANGLIARHETTLRGQRGEAQRPPSLYSLTQDGLRVAQHRTPQPAIHPKREFREIEASKGGRVAHDLHALWWTVALHHAVGDVATDNWKTPRYQTGRIPAPHTGTGARRRQITLAETFPHGQTAIDLQNPEPQEIKPDVTLELKVGEIVFDVLVEMDLTERPAYNRDKLAAYDAFLCAWWRAFPRYTRLGGPPIVIWVSRNERAALALAQTADQALTGRCGVIGQPPPNWYHAGRDHTFFAVEDHVHHGSLQLLALPDLPPKAREERDGEADPIPRRQGADPADRRGRRTQPPQEHQARLKRNGPHGQQAADRRRATRTLLPAAIVKHIIATRETTDVVCAICGRTNTGQLARNAQRDRQPRPPDRHADRPVRTPTLRPLGIHQRPDPAHRQRA